MATLGDSLPVDVDIYLEAKIFDDTIVVVKEHSGDKLMFWYNVYRNNVLTQPDCNEQEVLRYLSYVFSTNPKNPEIVKMKEEYAMMRAQRANSAQ